MQMLALEGCFISRGAFKTRIASMLSFFVKLVSGWQLLTNDRKSSVLASAMVLDTSLLFQKTFQCSLSQNLFYYVLSNKDSLKIISRSKGEVWWRYKNLSILGQWIQDVESEVWRKSTDIFRSHTTSF